MILYHFTSPYNLQSAGSDAILSAGLKAKDQRHHYPMFGEYLPPCVWFTSEWEYPSNSISSHSEVRLVVRFPKAQQIVRSGQLMSWPTWLKALRYGADAPYRNAYDAFVSCESDGSLPEGIGWRGWWVYFGDVPRKWIRSVEFRDLQAKAEAEAWR